MRKACALHCDPWRGWGRGLEGLLLGLMHSEVEGEGRCEDPGWSLRVGEPFP